MPAGSEELPFHLLANLLPLMEGDEFEELVEDIREHGLYQPIVLYEGAILDGRNRYRSCREAGVEPRFERKFTQEPETKRVDGRDVDLEKTRADVLPELGAFFELFDDSAAHLARGFARERDREDVSRARALIEQL